MSFEKFIILVRTFSESYEMRYSIQIEDGFISVRFLEVPGTSEYNKIVCDFIKCLEPFPCLLSSYTFVEESMFFTLKYNFSEDK